VHDGQRVLQDAGQLTGIGDGRSIGAARRLGHAGQIGLGLLKGIERGPPRAAVITSRRVSTLPASKRTLSRTNLVICSTDTFVPTAAARRKGTCHTGRPALSRSMSTA
jgi:hypothetical protein